jgi:hypothetical protein
VAAEVADASYHPTTMTLNLALPQTMGGADLTAWVERTITATNRGD